MTLRMAWSCMWCSSNFTPFNIFLKQVLISVFLLACYKSFWVSLYYLNIDVWTHLNLALEQIHCFILIVLLWRIRLQYSSGTPGKLFSFYLQVLNGPLVSYFCYFTNIDFYNIYSCFWLHAAWNWCVTWHDNFICLLGNCKFTILRAIM